MPIEVPSEAARDSLRRLLVSHSLQFGSRLLHRGTDGVITFREFVAVARELIEQRPEQTAVHLAVLVALDMHAGPDERPAPHPPSVN